MVSAVSKGWAIVRGLAVPQYPLKQAEKKETMELRTHFYWILKHARHCDTPWLASSHLILLATLRDVTLTAQFYREANQGSEKTPKFPGPHSYPASGWQHWALTPGGADITPSYMVNRDEGLRTVSRFPLSYLPP